MPLTLDYSKRLMARLDLPKDAETVLECPSYWDATPCELYFQACEELKYQDPQAALKPAQIAVRLARAVPEEDSPEGRRRCRDRRIRAHGILGSTYRALGRRAEARQSFDSAIRIARKGSSSSAKTLLYRRVAYFYAYWNELDQALAFAEKAKRVAESHNTLGAAYTARAYVKVKLGRYSGAVRDFGKALSLIDPRKEGGKDEIRRVRYAAIHNLAYAILQNPSPESLGDLQFYLREARKLVPAHRRSLPKYQLYWIEGLCLIKLGSGRRGERLVQRARAGFAEVGARYELALTGLDLSELYRDEGRWGECGELATETLGQFQALSADAEAIAALRLWEEAVQAKQLEDELIAEVKTKISERMRRSSRPSK